MSGREWIQMSFDVRLTLEEYENAGGIMDTFSRDFEVSYLETLR